MSPPSSAFIAPTPTANATDPSAQPPNGSPSTAKPATAPIPPPAQTFDELMADLAKTPLFMTSLDPNAENSDLDALRALAYEGTKAEVAGNFREQGNDCARAKRWVDAREFYDKALLVLDKGVPKGKAKVEERDVEIELGEDEDGERQVVDVEEEVRKEAVIKEACLVNRALCNLELKNYRSSTRDTLTALTLNPTNIKALYRLSLSLHSLQKHSESLQTLSRLLSLDPTNTPALTLRKTAQTSLANQTRAETLRREREDRARAEAAALRVALKERGIRVVTTEEGEGRGKGAAEAQDAILRLSDPLDAKSTLSIPVLLLYPTAAQSDLIQAVSENDTFGDHLGLVLGDPTYADPGEEVQGLPWDEAGEFGKVEGVECFMETVEGGLVKVGKKMRFGKVVGAGTVPVTDGLARVFVVPKGRVEGWVGEFKRRKGRS